MRSCSPGVRVVALFETHEEHDPLVAVPLLPDDQALEDLGHLLDLPIDLRRADADAAWVRTASERP